MDTRLVNKLVPSSMENLLGSNTTNKQQQQQQQQQQLQQLQQQQQQQLMQPSSIMDPKLGSTTTGGNPQSSIVGGGNPLSSYGAGGNPQSSIVGGGNPLSSYGAGVNLHNIIGGGGGNPLSSYGASGNPQSNIVSGGNPLSSYGAGGNPLSSYGTGGNPLSSIGNSITNIKQQLMPSSYTNQLIKNDRGSSMFMTSDDGAMIKHIQETHAPDGREVDVKPLLYLVEDILSRATIKTESTLLPVLGQTHSTDHEGLVEYKASHVGVVDMLDALSYLIDRISCEIALKCLNGSDAHGTTVSIFNLLSSYTWDAKLVLTLAAFALNYGEFWLLAQIYSSNPLAKSMAILRQLPVIIEHFNSLKPRFVALTNLINVMLEVTRCIVDLKELPSSYISQDVSELNAAKAFVPTAVYWTIRSVVACATQIHTLSGMGHEYIVSTTEAWELSTLAHKLNNILEHIRKLLRFCTQLIDRKKEEEDVAMLRDVFKIQIHIDNMKPLKLLIYAKDDIQPLVDGSTKKRVNIDVLRRKNVLLLISSLDISQDELEILEQIYNESRLHLARLESPFEVLWLPIVDPSIEWDNNMQTQFENLQSKMPWYWVHHPKLIEQASIRFIREEWQFRNKAILVVLDPQGKVVSPNAIHMMWIWGSTAFPFTTMKEISLWQEESYRLELLIDGIDQTILNWIKDGKYIILYGGDDIEWIRRFTAAARTVASALRIQLEMAYVGRSGKKEQQLRKVLSVINTEKLGYCWNDHPLIWFFWTRLESMLFSKIQLKQADDQDPMTQEIKKLLSYDKSSGGWAVLSRGSSVILTGHGSTVLDTLLELELWKEHVPSKGFDGAISGHHKHKIGEIGRPCSRFEFPSVSRMIPEGMKCPECIRPMEKHITYICCHEDKVGGHHNDSTTGTYI